MRKFSSFFHAIFSYRYIANDAANPEKGLFAGPNGATAQLTLEPTTTRALSFTYIHSHNNLNTETDSELTGDLFDDRAEFVITLPI